MSSLMQKKIPNTMGAWRKHRGKMEPVWEQIAAPIPHPTGILVKVIAAGVCRSDFNLLTNENQPSWFQEDFTLGHEGCGRIVQFGSAVSAASSGFEIGETIALFAVPGCGADDCRECQTDLPQLCVKGHRSGIGMDGFFAEYAVIDVRGAVHLPEGVTPSQAAVATDAVTTAYHAIHRRGRISSKDIVFLFGLGGLGFNGLQVIRAIGARVLVSDVKQENVDAAVRLGVPVEDVVPAGDDVSQWIRENGWTGKIDVVADFVGTSQTFTDAQSMVSQAGRIICIGTLNHLNTVNMKLCIRKRLDVLFSYGGQTQDLEEALELIAKGVLNPMVVDGKPQELPNVINDLEAGKIQGRVALIFDPEGA